MPEEAFVACGWSYGIRARHEEEDLARFEGWTGRYINNWALCDTLCNHTVGAFIKKFSRQVGVLRRWAESPNRWMKRAAAVSLSPRKEGRIPGGGFRDL